MSTRKLGWAVAGLTVALLLLTAGSAARAAVPVPIANPGFENPVLVDGDWDYSLDNEGWGYLDNDGNLGPWNVSASDYPAEAPEGQNVGWAEPGDGVPGGFAQVLTSANATLQEGMKYTLSVKVGASLSYSSGGYLVQLLAGGTPHTPGGGGYTGPVTGGTLLAQDSNTVTIAAGTFSNVVVTYTYDPAQSSLLGQPLQIRLLALPGGAETEFDDVQLTATFAPTPPLIITAIIVNVAGVGLVDVDITFNSVSGRCYRLQYTELLPVPPGSWVDVGTAIPATGESTTLHNIGVVVTKESPQRFYRVVRECP